MMMHDHKGEPRSSQSRCRRASQQASGLSNWSAYFRVSETGCLPVFWTGSEVLLVEWGWITMGVLRPAKGINAQTQ